MTFFPKGDNRSENAIANDLALNEKKCGIEDLGFSVENAVKRVWAYSNKMCADLLVIENTLRECEETHDSRKKESNVPCRYRKLHTCSNIECMYQTFSMKVRANYTCKSCRKKSPVIRPMSPLAKEIQSLKVEMYNLEARIETSCPVSEGLGKLVEDNGTPSSVLQDASRGQLVRIELWIRLMFRQHTHVVSVHVLRLLFDANVASHTIFPHTTMKTYERTATKVVKLEHITILWFKSRLMGYTILDQKKATLCNLVAIHKNTTGDLISFVTMSGSIYRVDADNFLNCATDTTGDLANDEWYWVPMVCEGASVESTD
jgi:hypothetical protein